MSTDFKNAMCLFLGMGLMSAYVILQALSS